MQILVCTRKGAHEGENAGSIANRVLLRAQELGAGRFRLRAYIPQPSTGGSANVEKTTLRRGGVPWRIPGCRVCYRQ